MVDGQAEIGSQCRWHLPDEIMIMIMITIIIMIKIINEKIVIRFILPRAQLRMIHSFVLFLTNWCSYVAYCIVCVGMLLLLYVANNFSGFPLKGKRLWNNIPEIGDICFISTQIEKEIIFPLLLFIW